jgi:hypothetical protein
MKSIKLKKIFFLFVFLSVSLILGDTVVSWAQTGYIANALNVDIYSFDYGIAPSVREQTQEFKVKLSDEFLIDESTLGVDYNIRKADHEDFPSICRYLYLTPTDEEGFDIGTSLPDRQNEYQVASGNLNKASTDFSDNWKLTLRTPVLKVNARLTMTQINMVILCQ